MVHLGKKTSLASCFRLTIYIRAEHGFYRPLFTGRHNIGLTGDCRAAGAVCFTAVVCFGSAVQARDETVHSSRGVKGAIYAGAFRL